MKENTGDWVSLTGREAEIERESKGVDLTHSRGVRNFRRRRTVSEKMRRRAVNIELTVGDHKGHESRLVDPRCWIASTESLHGRSLKRPG